MWPSWRGYFRDICNFCGFAGLKFLDTKLHLQSYEMWCKLSFGSCTCAWRLTLILGGPLLSRELVIWLDPVNEEDWLEEEEEEAAIELPASLCLRPSGGGCSLNLNGDGCWCPSSPPPGCWLREWESGMGGPWRWCVAAGFSGVGRWGCGMTILG